ncbi:MAG: hypothetical protein ACOYI5_01120 [Christensenellales bacterium]|jgi:hypothetical protein
MRKANIALLVIFVLLGSAVLAFVLGTNLRAEATFAREGDVVNCEITLTNTSLFPYEYIEIFAVPGDALTAMEGTGTTVPARSVRTVRASVRLPEGETGAIEIGYYVLGMRQSVRIRVP